nr:hypothetical protein [Undibacterium sp. Jales W-56]
MSNSSSSIQTTPLSELQTLPALFSWRVQQTPAAEAYRQYDEATAQ